jgi:hypothetical protein
MIRIKNYLINKDRVIYLEKYGLRYILVMFIDEDDLHIDCFNEEERDRIFDSIIL